jgi:hypothetical protein
MLSGRLTALADMLENTPGAAIRSDRTLLIIKDAVTNLCRSQSAVLDYINEQLIRNR